MFIFRVKSATFLHPIILLPAADIELVYWGSGIGQARLAGLEQLGPIKRRALSIETVAAGVVRGEIAAALGEVSEVMLSGNSDFFRASRSLPDASYEIKDVPPGSYELQVYGPFVLQPDGSGHMEHTVIQRIPVKVESGKTQVVDVMLRD
jgi:hypothetical protein